MKEYFIIFLFILIGILIGIGIQLISLNFAPYKPNKEKNSIYECGINIKDKNKIIKFNIRYYLIAILFIILDIETIFLFPWVISFKKLNFISYISMMIFILEFIIAYIYIWKKKVLDWNKNVF